MAEQEVQDAVVRGLAAALHETAQEYCERSLRARLSPWNQTPRKMQDAFKEAARQAVGGGDGIDGEHLRSGRT
jgi:hypothetical protein